MPSALCCTSIHTTLSVEENIYKFTNHTDAHLGGLHVGPSNFLPRCNEGFDETVTESIYAQCLPLHRLTFESNKGIIPHR
jgi:hypothetical protein